MNQPQTDAQKQGAILLGIIKSLQANWPAQSEILAHKALVCKTKFDEAVAKGFTEAQALEICTKDWSF